MVPIIRSPAPHTCLYFKSDHFIVQATPKARTGGGDKLEACPTSESIASRRLGHWPLGRFPHRSCYTLKQAGGKNEIRICKSPHLRSVETGYLGLSRNSNAGNLVLNFEEGVERSEHEDDVD